MKDKRISTEISSIAQENSGNYGSNRKIEGLVVRWIRKKGFNQYFCPVCNGKCSAPMPYCWKCGAKLGREYEVEDLVNVIRCKDCKHFYRKGINLDSNGNKFKVDSDRCIGGFNKSTAQLVNENDYCSRAERRTK